MTADRTLARRYRLVRHIASGGMAEVWEGHDDVLDRPVAVKVLHTHLAHDEGLVERFRREAVAAARLAHPGIVATYDAGTDGDVAFIVMELVRGRTLRQALEEAGTFPPALAVHVAAQVADALDHAHRAGLVHRDVKPANILLADEDGGSGPQLRVKVADFGIAKLQLAAEAGDLTQTGAVVGTAKYLSPEQVQGRPPDARSDEYAVGVVLYEMLCGQAPFEADTDVATAFQHVRAQPPPLGQLRSGIPARLEAVVLRAMAKDPGDRYPSAAHLRDALLALVGDQATAGGDAAGGDATATHLTAIHPPGDDAVPQVVRERTPPRGIPALARPPRRRWAPAAFLFLLAAAVVTSAAVLLQGTSDPRDRRAPNGTLPETVTIASVRSFDPEGSDGEENEARARLAHDGDPATSWTTDRYNTRSFGGLKRGVGLVLGLEGGASLARLEVRSPTSGWSASVYVADQPGRTLDDWGRPVATRSGIAGDATFDLRGRRAGAVLVWITDPGEANRAEVAEVALSG